MSDHILSGNGRFIWIAQNDGNFVGYRRNPHTGELEDAFWATHTTTHPPAPSPPGPEPPVPPPQGPLPVVAWGGAVGASHYTSLTDPALDLEGFAQWLFSTGCTFTRVWLLDAWAVGANGPGQYFGYLPFRKDAGSGKWNLFDWDPTYFDQVRTYVTTMNRWRVVPILTLLELYTWSDRKQGMLWVPDANVGPWRNNINGVRWGNPDDPTFFGLPDEWHREFIRRVVEALTGTSYLLELGNEMPEKELHYRLRDAARVAGYGGDILINRQDDTPGQYANMRIGEAFERISYHGKRDLSYLDADHPEEPTLKTFREFYESGSYDPARIILSSDGCRKTIQVNDAYDYPRLLEVASDGLARGFNYEHQTCIKLRKFNEGYLTLDDLSYDEEFVRALTGKWA